MSWEVRTMRSATSYFNFTLLRKNFARFWPIWSLYGLFWLAVLPLNILSNRIHWDGGMARSLPLNYLDGGPSAAVTLTALFGLLCAMAVFSYLYASRSVGMLHALPLRREGLFLTNYLSGLLFLLLPNLAVFLLALAAEVFAGTVVFSSLFTWLVVVSLFGLFFYSFAVFCAMFTGHVLALLLLCKQAAKNFHTICKKETALKRVLSNLLSAVSLLRFKAVFSCGFRVPPGSGLYQSCAAGSVCIPAGQKYCSPRPRKSCPADRKTPGLPSRCIGHRW